MARYRQETPTEVEMEILQVLWERRTATVREVVDVLNQTRTRDYPSILSMLNVMLEKGLVVREEIKILSASFGQDHPSILKLRFKLESQEDRFRQLEIAEQSTKPILKQAEEQNTAEPKLKQAIAEIFQLYAGIDDKMNQDEFREWWNSKTEFQIGLRAQDTIEPSVRDGNPKKDGPRVGDSKKTGPRDGEAPKVKPRDSEEKKHGASDRDTLKLGPRDGEASKVIFPQRATKD